MTRKSRNSRNLAAVTVMFPLLSWLSASSLIRMPCEAWLLAKKLACSSFCRCSAVSYSFFTIGCWVSACWYLACWAALLVEVSCASRCWISPWTWLICPWRVLTSCEAAS